MRQFEVWCQKNGLWCVCEVSDGRIGFLMLESLGATSKCHFRVMLFKCYGQLVYGYWTEVRNEDFWGFWSNSKARSRSKVNW